MIRIIHPSPSSATDSFLDGFGHSEHITAEWTRGRDGWELSPADSINTWEAEKRVRLSQWMHEAAESGCLAAAYEDEEDRLVGFGCIDGISGGAANLAMLFTDSRYKRRGIGKALFHELAETAKALGAARLYISSVPTDGTVAFYFSLGCRDADVTIEEFTDSESDRPLIYELF